MLRYENEHVYYNVFESMKFNNKETRCYKIVVLEELVRNPDQREPPDKLEEVCGELYCFGKAEERRLIVCDYSSLQIV
jgi:hypothetical protein